MYKANIDKENHLSILEPRHARELFDLVDKNRSSISKWLNFPHKTKEVQDSANFIEKSLQRLAANNY